MCALKPTKEPVYLRKKSTTIKAKVVKSASASPVFIRADSTQAGSEASTQYDYVIRAKPSHNKQKGKNVNCTCGKCPAGGNTHASDKARVIIRDDPRKRCNCKGSDNDGWLCDACRAAQKKKGVWKILSCASGAENGACCCGGCGNGGNAKREDAQARFEREVDEWVKESKLKMKRKNAKNGKVVCNCHRPGCKVCVFVRC